MKAIILAAGQGLRLRPLTNDKPKCMVHYNGRPIIKHQFDVLKECGIHDIFFVGGYKADKVVLEKNVHCIINHEYSTTNMVYTLFCAKEEFNDDILIIYGDIIFKKNILSALIEAPDDIAVTIDKDWYDLWKQRMDDPLQDAETLKFDSNGYIYEIGKKPNSYDDIQGQYMGLIKFSKNILPQVMTLYNELDRTALYDGKDFNNMYMTSFLQLLIDRCFSVKAVEINGGWLEIDAINDLEVKI
ncbi:sugar nucleotidyltransferase [Candidatus Magnetomorum sp. HK-1]|nr:sugar nucleotidyltransferase [Candidatus Magnetomorum sp. HK-1]